jgi:hypothetical protein
VPFWPVSALSRLGLGRALPLCSPDFGRVTVRKLKSPSAAPGMSSSVSTSTRSSPRSGRSRTKLAPWPSECSRSVPAWSPVRDPRTVIGPSSAAGAPRRLICVSGEADMVPGIGNAPIWAPVVV